MTICINGVNRDEKSALGFISKPDCDVEQIVRAWCRAKVCHCFENKDTFRKAVKKNRKTLETPKIINRLFTSSNYLFSTVTDHRLETLYFKDKATKRSGRLRQQHRLGPLAKINKKPKTHLFLSKRKRDSLWKWHEKNRRKVAKIGSYEQQAEDHKYHIEFACDGHRTRGWHLSEGTVRTSRRNLNHRIGSALKNILGIHSEKIKK
jgi:hypothetical protein